MATAGGSEILAIDFGTTFTSVASSAGGIATLVGFADGTTRFPSSVFRADGVLVTGRQADAQAALDPLSYHPTPKRLVGERSALLGDSSVPVVDIIAAVLRDAAAEPFRQGLRPALIKLTCPAEWGEPRRQMLLAAAEKAGLAAPELVTEPVAAAAHYARTAALEPGQSIAIYDLGGGTFDAAVVRAREDGGFDVLGHGGIDRLGGVDFDDRLREWVGRTKVREVAPEAWANLSEPPDAQWRRHRRDFLIAVRDAKEALSGHPSQRMFVPGANTDVLITRDEFEDLIRSDVDATITELQRVLKVAGHTPAELAAVYLVGGSSRIPLVASAVWEALGVQPTTRDDPKAVVALGAVYDAAREPARTTPAPRQRRTRRASAPAVPPVIDIDKAIEARRAGAAGTVTPTAGEWRPDTTGRHELRWFDGITWTDHVSDRGVTSTDPFSRIEPRKPGGQKRTWPVPPALVIGAAGIFVLGLLAWFVTSLDNDPERGSGSSSGAGGDTTTETAADGFDNDTFRTFFGIGDAIDSCTETSDSAAAASGAARSMTCEVGLSDVHLHGWDDISDANAYVESVKTSGTVYNESEWSKDRNEEDIGTYLEITTDEVAFLLVLQYDGIPYVVEIADDTEFDMEYTFAHFFTDLAPESEVADEELESTFWAISPSDAARADRQEYNSVCARLALAERRYADVVASWGCSAPDVEVRYRTMTSAADAVSRFPDLRERIDEAGYEVVFDETWNYVDGSPAGPLLGYIDEDGQYWLYWTYDDTPYLGTAWGDQESVMTWFREFGSYTADQKG